MTVVALKRRAPEAETPPTAAVKRTLLRFITCGSVDDGKSTLIGRLLFDAAALPDDQIEALRRESSMMSMEGGDIDYSLLLDGLAAEREQGITIDVAYRYFSTHRRSFIVADTPGHEQYTRNMATGASTADLAVILVDARKGVLEQTRRHAEIVSLMGVRQVVLAVNKMDLVERSQSRFREIEAAFAAFADSKGFTSLTAIPLAAKLGENVRDRARTMSWYSGPTLLEVLEQAEPGAGVDDLPARFVVQWVNRPSSDFRGFSGALVAGSLRPGDEVRILPSGLEARIARIVAFDGDLSVAVRGQMPTLVLDREVDVSRGNVIVAASSPIAPARRLHVDLLWLSTAAWDPSRGLLLKIGSATVPAHIDRDGATVLDIATGQRKTFEGLACNDIASLTVATDVPVVAETYADSRELGGFILIDRLTADTVALGMVRGVIPNESLIARGEHLVENLASVHILARPVETRWRSFLKAVSWRATGSVDTFLLAYLFTGHAKVAAAISGTEVATKIVLYFVHERLWQRIAPGRYDRK